MSLSLKLNHHMQSRFALCIVLFLSTAVHANQDEFQDLLNIQGAFITEQGKLFANDGVADDFFGLAVSISGSFAVVGANGNDEVDSGAGAAYVFQFNGSSWVFKQKLMAFDGAASDQFGQSVAIDGDQILVGAPKNNNVAADAGAAYAFEYNGVDWIFSQKITASDGDYNDWFGFAVDIDGDRAVISASQDDELSESAGSVYVFSHDGNEWQEADKLLASDGITFDRFGQSVSVEGDRILVGAFYHQLELNGDAFGAAYVFDYDGVNWSETQKLMSDVPRTSSYFGYSVDLSGDWAIIGSQRDTGNVNFSGAAYAFNFNGSAWNLDHKFTVSNMNSSGQLGSSVSIKGQRVVIGARRENANGSSSGAAYVYDYQDGDWNLFDKILSVDTTANDEFGVAVATTGGRTIVGAFKDDIATADEGAAFVFDVPFDVTVRVNGLASGNQLLISNNGTEDLMINDNGWASFSTPLSTGAMFDVTVINQPTSPNQTCVVSNPTGTVAEHGLSEIQINCVTNPYFIALTVEGLYDDNQLELQNNGSDHLQVNESGAYVFNLPVDDFTAYDVTIISQPQSPIQECSVVNGDGVVNGQDVNDVYVACDTGTDRIFANGFEVINQ